jgi:hypothetical protein
MTEFENRAECVALWSRWKTAHVVGRLSEPNPLLLAAYAEHRLDEDTATEVEAWLAANPERIEDITTAAGRDPAAIAPARVVEKAIALVPADGAAVVPFQHPRRRVSGMRLVLAWGGMAASIAATGFVGFALGSDAYGSFMGTDQEVQTSVSQDLFAPPTAIFSDPGEESNI